MKIPFLDLTKQHKPIQNDIHEAVLSVIDSGQYIGGETVVRFEREAAEYLAVRYAYGCSNGTDALMLALRACEVEPGDEVITTAFSFFATAEAIAAIGAVPVFVDVRETDYNIDPKQIEVAVTERTKAILPVHLFGAPCRMKAIREIADRHGLYVIEDAAQGFGSRYQDKSVGGLGDIGCFSFYPTKNLGGCGDGGMVTTNDERLAVRLAALKEHGAGKKGAQAVGKEVAPQQGDGSYDPYKYFNYMIGYNSRLDAIQAAVLSIRLGQLDDYNKQRAEIAARYMDGLTGRVELPAYEADITPCWHQFVIRTDQKEGLIGFLSEQGVGCGNFYPVPLHRQMAFTDSNSRTTKKSLEVAERMAKQTVCLPIYPGLSDEAVEYVIEQVNRFFEEQ